MIASVWVTRFLEEEIVACFFKTQVLDVMARQYLKNIHLRD